MKIHILSLATASAKNMLALENYIKGRNQVEIINRFDPSVNRALDFMFVEQIVKRQSSNNYITLLPKGKKLFEKIMKDQELMMLEKNFFNTFGQQLTEEIVSRPTLF
ncbi:hypothetical protein [Candidatus Enterococcus ferrettii]|uniref:Uncharacterized protein n=1 Tax=Candidatus Enterococcus ferrettii TaxID=2815324 RepID=A0ABV0EPN9_9ENTE|nr:hypothetical protein [Enterococcus sp. 665A]MBO1338915.1 hypothetical protein [Enterococcus sp. 665A]